jgi:hypothetical protein
MKFSSGVLSNLRPVWYRNYRMLLVKSRAADVPPADRYLRSALDPFWGCIRSIVSPNSEKVIIDTDIGDDVDDAFAVVLALRSPELQILGISTVFGDTQVRVKLLDRLLGEAGRQDIPVLKGTPTDAKTSLSQRPYAEGGHFARSSHDGPYRRLPDRISSIIRIPVSLHVRLSREKMWDQDFCRSK